MRALLLFIFVLTSPCLAKKKKAPVYAAGISLISPTGIVGRFRWKKNKTLDASLGFFPELEVHAGILYEKGALTPKTRWYWGLGPRWKSGSLSSIGIRLVSGIKYRERRSRLSYYSEVITAIDLFGDTGIKPSIALGLLYYY